MCQDPPPLSIIPLFPASCCSLPAGIIGGFTVDYVFRQRAQQQPPPKFNHDDNYYNGNHNCNVYNTKFIYINVLPSLPEPNIW